MKEIKAIIQPFLLEKVLAALHEIEGLPGVIISEAKAASVARGHYEQVVKTKLEIMAPNELVESILTVIQASAHTGNPGDGGIFVISVETAMTIRTGERIT